MDYFKYKTFKTKKSIRIEGEGLIFEVNSSVKLYALKEVRKALAEIKEIKKEIKIKSKNTDKSSK